MEVKLFDLRLWADWLARTVIVGGALFWALFIAMQWEGIEVEINLPTIQHTFAHTRK